MTKTLSSQNKRNDKKKNLLFPALIGTERFRPFGRLFRLFAKIFFDRALFDFFFVCGGNYLFVSVFQFENGHNKHHKLIPEESHKRQKNAKPEPEP